MLFLPSGCDKESIPPKKDTISKPNLILISIDTLRADHLGCYGYGRPTSPALDKLASEGVLFQNVTASSPWTLPSHGSMLTGYYPGRLGLNSYESMLPSDVTTLASILSEQGFATSAIVSCFFTRQKYGFDKGFNNFVFLGEDVKKKEAASSIIELATQWIKDHCNKQFILFLHFFDVHSDYSPMEKYKKQFVGPYKGRANGSTGFLYKVRTGEISLNENDVQHIIDLYDAEIKQLDDRLKGLFDFLRKQGILENSYIIVTSDHGEEFLDHGGTMHGRTHYQELLHVPLIIYGPKIPRAIKINTVISLVDIMPTALNLLGISIPAGLDGISLCPLWKMPDTEPAERFIFSEADHGNEQDNIKRAVRYGDYKLHYDLLSKTYELYNIATDPSERNNIASEQTDLVDLMFKELKGFMQHRKQNAEKTPLSEGEFEKLKSLGYM
jgi:arylsulfatase A-like enzyme